MFTLNLDLALAQTSTPATATLTHSQRHKIKVRNAALAQKILAAGGSLIADYGSYQLYDASDLAADLATNNAVEIHDEYNVVMLNAKHLDTTQPETKALRHRMGSFKGKKMHLVQFVGPVQPEWRDELLATGVTIVSYIPENSYLVYGDAASIAKVQALAGATTHIQWEGEYANDYKIHPRARARDSKGKPRTVGTDLFAIQLLADDEANTNTFKLLESLKSGAVQKQRSVLHYINVVGPDRRATGRGFDPAVLPAEIIGRTPGPDHRRQSFQQRPHRPRLSRVARRQRVHAGAIHRVRLHRGCLRFRHR
jgi:hypothetical protein